MTITDEMLIAYLGGKLSETDRMAVEKAVESDPSVAERLRRHREVGAMIQNAISAGARKGGRAAAGDGTPAAVVSLADARKTREAPAPKAAREAKPRKPVDPRWGALAAGLVVGGMIGLFVPKPTQQLVDGDLFARSALAATLERRLAAEQKPGAPVRVIATFHTRDGAWCRTFDSKLGLSGLACRGKDGWRVLMSEMGMTQPSPALVATVTALKLGQPVDAATERKGRAAGWR